MTRIINQFMWGYQDLFRFVFENRTKEIINKIAPSLSPRAYLVGIRHKNITEGHEVCVEPEKGLLKSGIFKECLKRALEIEKVHPGLDLIYGDEPSMRDKPEKIFRSSVREAINEITKQYDIENKTISFLGHATSIDNYYVVPIIFVEREQFEQYPYLVERISFDNWESDNSLIESVIIEILEVVTNVLESNDQAEMFRKLPYDPVFYLRPAARRFCNVITFSTRSIILQETFDILNTISSLPYESEEVKGSICFINDDNSVIDLLVRFKQNINFREYKLIRKIIEMCNINLECVCNQEGKIIGLRRINNKDEPIFRVVFNGAHKWDLLFENKVLMKVAYGNPSLPVLQIDKPQLDSLLVRVFKDISDESIDILWDIARYATSQRHGTMIVVSDNAEAEASRLKSQSINIAPMKLTTEEIQNISKIDGAVLIDTEGECYALGVLLDGMATDEGNMSRGARYNSALRYIRTKSEIPTVCIVISEDGYVDIFPKLRPQISHMELKGNINEFSSSSINNYHKSLNWLDSNRFYLNSEECKLINRKVKLLEDEVIKASELWIVRDTFVPNPDMNDEYFNDKG